MTPTYAVIDIGTLKVKTVIASVTPTIELTTLYSSNTLTCFGCEVDTNNGYVLEKNLIKTIDELKRIKKLFKEYKVTTFKVISTHALRRAKNKKEIIQRFNKELGFEIENISQQQEAELFFRAVMETFPAPKEYAIVDIGGGSVQILLGNAKNLKRTHLMQTGSAYLHENFTHNSQLPSSFTKIEDIEIMKEYILQQMIALQANTQEIPIIYGSSNIIDLMKALNIPLDKHEHSSAHPYKTYADHLEVFMKKILPLTYEQREKQYKFQKGYMWGVDKAFLNIITIADYFKSPYIIPSNANIAQGVIFSLLENQ